MTLSTIITEYRKGVAVVTGAVAEIVSLGVLPHSVQHWIVTAIAVLTSIGVIAVPNVAPVPPVPVVVPPAAVVPPVV